MRLIQILKLIRPQQWVKNGFVFLPLFFSGNLLDGPLLISTIIAFFSFSFAASSIYCLNDYKDADADRQHPVKCKRPVASGAVSKGLCLAIMCLLTIASICILLLLPRHEFVNTAFIIAAYLILNYAYCFKLKQIAIVDVTIVSIGFVLRVIAGGTSTGIPISHWIVIMTFLLALFLALSKRRDDILLFEQTGKKMRRNIDRYNLRFTDQATTLVATVMLVSYIMYTVSAEVVVRFSSNYVYLTSVFVLLGLLRYFQVTVVFEKSGSPTKVLMHDRFLQLCLVGWGLTFAVIIYL